MKFKPGFRISKFDLLFLLFGLIISIIVASIEIKYAIIIFIPFAAFFLFCNVFRVRRIPELIWALFFILNTSICGIYEISLIISFIPNVLLLIILIFNEFFHPSYHGLWWERINPNLKIYWEKNLANKRIHRTP
jgi:hypothetical protein